MKNLKTCAIVLAILVLTVSCGLFDNAKTTSETDAPTDSKETIAGGGEKSESTEANETPRETEKVSLNQTFTVRFGKEKTSRAYSKKIGRGGSHNYVLGAKKGQKMNVRLSSSKNFGSFEVRDPAGNKLDDGDPGVTLFGKTLPSDGNYKITVIGPEGDDDYTVSFSVTGGLEAPAPPRSGGLSTTVKFAKGKTSATYENAVIRGERNTYGLGAKAGQLMSVNITSLENNAVFQIKGPNGYLRGVGPGTDRTSWSGQLPASGKYSVVVGGTRGNATYKITFSIR